MKYEFVLPEYGNLLKNKNVVIANCNKEIFRSVNTLFSSQGASVWEYEKARQDGISADVLICSVNVSPSGLFDQTPIAEIKADIEKNLLYNVEVINSFIGGMMQKRYGAIVNIFPQYATHAVSGVSKSAMISGALMSLTQSLAMDYCKYNVRANCIEYGTLLPEDDITDETKAKLIDMQPLRRICTTEDIANAALFLASSMSAFISGETIPVNGGAFCIGHNNAWDNYLKLI